MLHFISIQIFQLTPPDEKNDRSITQTIVLIPVKRLRQNNETNATVPSLNRLCKMYISGSTDTPYMVNNRAVAGRLIPAVYEGNLNIAMMIHPNNTAPK